MNRLLATPAILSILFGCGSGANPPAEPSRDVAGVTPGPVATVAGDDAPAAAPASQMCEHLATACHDHAGFSAVTEECHTIGHRGDAAACEARHDECMAACAEAAKSGTHAHPAPSGTAPAAPHHH